MISSVYRIGLANIIETADDCYTNIKELVTGRDLIDRSIGFLGERGFVAERDEDGTALSIHGDEAAREDVHTALCCLCASLSFLFEAELNLVKARMRARR